MQAISHLLAEAQAAHHGGDLARASELYRRALALDANHPQALHGAALLAHDVGHAEPALALMARAASRAPRDPAVHHDHATLLAFAGRRAEAIAAYCRALASNPANAETHANLGTLLLFDDLTTDAITHLTAALELAPRHAPAQHNLAHALLAQGRHREALEAYRRAVELEPGNPEPQQNMLFVLLCADGVAPEELAAEHIQWAALHARPQAPKALANVPEKQRRLRVGYLSPDFRGHSVASFIAPVLANHDREQVEVFCYADVAVPDDVTGRLREHADHWAPVPHLPDVQLAHLIRNHVIDVLVDLAGHTRHNRLRLFASRLAPVQVSYLGYAHATGLSTMDLRLTDAIADPPGVPHAGLEPLHRLPAPFLCYAPPAGAPPVSALPALSNGHVTFGSFNNTAKLTTKTLDLWSEVLRAVPSARLVLKAQSLKDEALRQRFRAAFETRGIDGSRLTLLPPAASQAEHLTAYGQIDIALDTFPYHGTTTTCEALHMGVPVVTLAGPCHHSRVGATLLAAVGLGDLVTESPAAYVECAARLAHDLPALAELRTSLRGRLAQSPLCDGRRLAANLEVAYRQAWECWCERQSVTSD